MSLFMKQNFTPPILSRKWIATKFRPNMLLHNRQHIISILESGLLFREDSVDVEQGAPSPEEVWNVVGGDKTGWFTLGERIISLGAVSISVIVYPPKSFHRSTLLMLAGYAALPFCIRSTHRWLSSRSPLRMLMLLMRDYLALARRAAACLKESAAVHTQLGSVSSAIESTHTLLCRQQSELAVMMSRASSALLGNVPWLRDDLAWQALHHDHNDNLMKIHHAFLVIQSTLLKHIAMAHFVPSTHVQKLYKNYNERIYWIHNTLINYLIEELRQNYEALDRMYRLLKNYDNRDYSITKTPCSALNDNWMYSDVHSGIARASLELKFALNKCTNLDMFLDSCALNKKDIDLDVLNKDINGLIDDITKCLNTTQNSQIRLRKLKNKFSIKETDESVKQKEIEIDEENNDIIKIEDQEPDSKDEVFYFVKMENDESDETESAGDLTTGPSQKERETTKVMLNELKKKLVRRENVMRERERQALVKTMPQFKDNLPEFPRQINIEFFDHKGLMKRLNRTLPKKRLFKNYKIQSHLKKKSCKRNKYKLKIKKYEDDVNIKEDRYEANSKMKFKKHILTVTKICNFVVITKWYKDSLSKKNEIDSSGMSEELSDLEVDAVNKTHRQSQIHHDNIGDVNNIRFTKKDLELSPSSESDLDDCNKENQRALLNDIRRYRVVRKKNYPVKRASIDKGADESLRPIEYSFGTGMAMASMLQVNNNCKLPRMAQEEVFIGDGEVSSDSGNDEDA